MSLLLSKSEQGIVVFQLWKNLNYSIRLFLSFILILAGIFLQYQTFNLIPGIVLVFSGNLFLLVKGYDNRIKLGAYSHEAEWVATDPEHLEKVVSLNSKMRKWDISALDITSRLGAFLFLIILIVIYALAVANPFNSLNALLILLANIVVLIFPHWFTGVKRITTAPALVNKIKFYQNLLRDFQINLKEENVSFLMLLKGKNQKLPADIKMKVKFKDQSQNFLGFYAQLSMNNVQGKDYPYFYIVLVAKESAGIIKNILAGLQMPTNVISEFSHQDDAEILVIRQYTTKDSGYYTDETATSSILKAGLETARKLIK